MFMIPSATCYPNDVISGGYLLPYISQLLSGNIAKCLFFQLNNYICIYQK